MDSIRRRKKSKGSLTKFIQQEIKIFQKSPLHLASIFSLPAFKCREQSWDGPRHKKYKTKN